MNQRIASALVVLTVGLSMTACGSKGENPSSNSGNLPVSGFTVPTEISAVPTSQLTGVVKPGLLSKLSALAATDPGTDYSNAQTVKFVNEHTLKQFDIIETILKALAQTNYADAVNINQGPYKAMIAWQEERGGMETKTLEPWVVDSTMITESGEDVNRVQVWIEEVQDGMTRLIKAEFKIYQSATQRDDGAYSDYGVWTLNVKFGDSADIFFAADADIDADGHAVVRIHERMMEGGPNGPAPRETKAVMNRSETQGFGKVMFPDWESCDQPDCNPDPVEAKYAYNANHLAMQKAAEPVQFKDRTTINEMTHRYGLFDSATGQNVMKTKSFGFPVSYTDSGNRRFAYYGAWQGRHQLWAGDQAVPQGTVVTRQDRGNEQTAETYTVSAPFVGTLTKRIPVQADINDVKGIPVETWVNSNFQLRYLASGSPGWYECQFSPNSPPTCNTLFTAFDSLIVGENDNRKFVNINQWDNVNQQPINYVYLPATDASTAGFYLADFDPSNGRATAIIPLLLYSPNDNDQLWINVGGSIYIEYTGTDWVEKTLTGFDTTTWTPEFDPNGDKPYELPLDREFYINSRGANYIVKRTNSGYDVKIEIQTTANPVNAATFVPAGTVFKTPWAPDTDSTYEFITDPSSTKFMKLVYKAIGQNEPSPAPTPGDVVQKGQWGLMAYASNNTSTGVQFNWDYPREGDMWGSQQYLQDASNNYVLLSDPILLQPVTLMNNAGVDKTLSLQYDGWMHGLPDLFQELQKNGFVMTQDIADKIINIPAGTEVVDAQDDTKHYLVKPLEVSQFLAVLPTDPGDLDLTAAGAINLDTDTPTFVDHNMGAMPSTTGVKYSEGNLVQ